MRMGEQGYVTDQARGLRLPAGRAEGICLQRHSRHLSCPLQLHGKGMGRQILHHGLLPTDLSESSSWWLRQRRFATDRHRETRDSGKSGRFYKGAFIIPPLFIEEVARSDGGVVSMYMKAKLPPPLRGYSLYKQRESQ